MAREKPERELCVSGVDPSKIRIAFLTPEFPEFTSSGGLGSYILRICRVLKGLGHDPEVITLSREGVGPIQVNRILVHRVHHPRRMPWKGLYRFPYVFRTKPF